MNLELVDRVARGRFESETSKNFSVIAPAGVGKTTAIAKRIACLALQDAARKDPVMPRLALVTFTRKAAEEMQERTLRELENRDAGAEVCANLGRAFFGTLHGFCLDLVKRYGPFVGLPGTLEPVENTDCLWREFVQSRDDFLSFLPSSAREPFRRHASLTAALEVARQVSGASVAEPGSAPAPDFEAILSYQSTTGRQPSSGVIRGKAIAGRIKERFEAGEAFQIPKHTLGGAAFQQAWREAFEPLACWLGDATHYLAIAVSEAFREFRLERGFLEYDDMVLLARKIVRNRALWPRIAAERTCVVVDEAQDTGSNVFDVLLAVSSDVYGSDVESPNPSAGRYCMVGDPQQSIYRSRADITVYAGLHRRLCESGVAEALSLEVTMRCPRAVVAFANDLFPRVFAEGGVSQAKFVKLEARPDALGGRVERHEVPVDAGSGLQGEAEAVAKWLAGLSPAQLGCHDWSEVAVLAPRKTALDRLHAALVQRGMASQRYSTKRKRGELPPVAFLASLFRLLNFPGDGLEIAGLIRELFGVDDRCAALALRGLDDGSGWPDGLTLDRAVSGGGLFAESVRRLRAVWLACGDLAPLEALREADRQLCLQERIAALNPGYGEDLVVEWRKLVAAVAAWEAAGCGIADVAQRLADIHARDLSVEAALPGHIQLLTCHKAKGLEWRVVILPFLAYPLQTPTQSFPRLLDPGEGMSPRVAFCDVHPHGHLADASAETDMRERQRLFYVAVTRSSYRLILIDGSGAYTKPGKPFKLSSRTMAAAAGFGGECRLFPELPKFDTEAIEVAPARPHGELRATFFEAAKGVNRAEFHPARRRVLPSSLSHSNDVRSDPEESPEPEFPELAGQTGGTEYGNWWHGIAEALPWADGCAAVFDAIEQAKDSAFSDRGLRELAALARSGWVERLCAAERVRVEVPLYWCDGDTDVYDGFIDLLALGFEGDGALVLDWKTDQRSTDDIVLNYRDQIQVYQRAVSAIYGAKCRAMLYSTLSGCAVEIQS